MSPKPTTYDPLEITPEMQDVIDRVVAELNALIAEYGPYISTRIQIYP